MHITHHNITIQHMLVFISSDHNTIHLELNDSEML